MSPRPSLSTRREQALVAPGRWPGDDQPLVQALPFQSMEGPKQRRLVLARLQRPHVQNEPLRQAVLCPHRRQCRRIVEGTIARRRRQRHGPHPLRRQPQVVLHVRLHRLGHGDGHVAQASAGPAGGAKVGDPQGRVALRQQKEGHVVEGDHPPPAAAHGGRRVVGRVQHVDTQPLQVPGQDCLLPGHAGQPPGQPHRHEPEARSAGPSASSGRPAKVSGLAKMK